MWNQPIKELEKQELDQTYRFIQPTTHKCAIYGCYFNYVSYAVSIIGYAVRIIYDQNATFVKMRLSVALALVPHPQRSLPNLPFYSTNYTIHIDCTRL